MTRTHGPDAVDLPVIVEVHENELTMRHNTFLSHLSVMQVIMRDPYLEPPTKRVWSWELESGYVFFKSWDE